MQSKTSCFNKAIFRKNLTRFAPVMGLYTLLLLMMLLMAQNSVKDYVPAFYFLNQVDGVIQMMGAVNLVYAALMAQLLFGDLYMPRMCNALHALPLRRESWFVTNVVSGLVYSLVPTAVAAVVLAPMLMKTIFLGAWKIAFWFFVAANLEFICLFGIAVFSTMLVGSRFTMVAGYGLLNAGAYILYWLIDTVYTPMLYGMVTPNSFAYRLTPLYYMLLQFVKPAAELRNYTDDFGRLISGAQATYEMTDAWNALWVLALVGIVFAIAALLLYRRRNLECAGDAVCSRKLIPVFQILSALFVAVAAEFVLYLFFERDTSYLTFIFLFAGLIVGWFAGKMLVERSARVFQPKNWIGLGILAAVLAVTLGLNKLDVLNLEERKPELQDIVSVEIGTDYAINYTTKEQADFENILKFHALALEDRVEESGSYVLEDGAYVQYYNSSYRYRSDEEPLPEIRNAVRVNLTYTLKDGKEVNRRYNVWADAPAGQMVKDMMSRWDAVNYQTITWKGEDKVLPVVLGSFKEMSCSTFNGECPENLKNRSAAESLIRAIQADCEAGTMVQDPRFHKGVFVIPGNREPYETQYIYISLNGEKYSWNVEIYPECVHTIQWLRDNGLLDDTVTTKDQGESLRLY